MRCSCRHLVLWMGVVCTAWLQAATQQAGSAENDRKSVYELRGTVVNSATGKPLWRAFPFLLR
jgi:hypothetical protein